MQPPSTYPSQKMSQQQAKTIRKSTLRSILIATIFSCCVASFCVQRQVKDLLTKDLKKPQSYLTDSLAEWSHPPPSQISSLSGRTRAHEIKTSTRNEIVAGGDKGNDKVAFAEIEFTNSSMLSRSDASDDKDERGEMMVESGLSNSSVSFAVDVSYNSSLGLPKDFPKWARRYFNWHNKRRRNLNETNWKSQKYLMLRCTHEDKKCGGLADRLKPLPYLLLLAARHKRIFMIRWNTPSKLEEFLLPNKLNWSVPDWMEEKLLNNEVSRVSKLTGRKFNHLKKTDLHATVIEGRMQDLHGGADYYEKIVTDPNETYEKVYHNLFKALFTPSPPIQELIDAKMNDDGLKPGEYAVAHYRAFYGYESKKHKRTKAKLKHLAVNAVNCASVFRPGGPVYFASDSEVAVKTVKQYAKKNKLSISVLDGDEPLHIDKFGPENPKPPSAFYSVFVDLLLMANGNCVTFGQGGFGRFALLLSNNATCTGRHIYRNKPQECEWNPKEI